MSSLINRTCVLENEFTPLDELLLTQLVDVALQQRPNDFSSISTYLVCRCVCVVL